MQEKETVGPLFKVHQIIRNTKHLRITLSSKNEFAPPCHFNGKFHNVILIWLPYLFCPPPPPTPLPYNLIPASCN